jgi:hypothetical protein
MIARDNIRVISDGAGGIKIEMEIKGVRVLRCIDRPKIDKKSVIKFKVQLTNADNSHILNKGLLTYARL